LGRNWIDAKSSKQANLIVIMQRANIDAGKGGKFFYSVDHADSINPDVTLMPRGGF